MSTSPQDGAGPIEPGAGPTLLGVNLAHRLATLPPDLMELAHGLSRELVPLQERALPVPWQKAQLTRRGGRCPTDGTPLTFDPWIANVHRCPRCGAEYRGADHDAWWAMGAQLWCAERAVHAAMLGALLGRPALYALAGRMLDAFADRYAQFPNRDNALGPSRPFFSTYLESVWLLNGTLAMQLLKTANVEAAARNRFASTVVVPSRALIGSFPEGTSNRQAWHTAAQLAAAIALEDHRALPPLLDGPVGVATLVANGLLPDGTWYEGENYHLFAHRGLWYGVTLLESLGWALPAALGDRFTLGFRTPFLGVLPDGTFPSRRDSRYRVSVHQLRFAEWCELGLARTDDPVLEAWRHRLYHAELPWGDTGRTRSTADIERDEPACALRRSDLGWRTLLMAGPAPAPGTEVASQGGVMLAAQGLAVLRTDRDRLYVSMECGGGGGGHGHPDALSLTLQDGERRVLDDPGTGSYVERTLHWYRSTLAHNAPLIDGRSQTGVAVGLQAFSATDAGGEISAWMRDAASGALVERSVQLADTLVFDTLHWRGPAAITLDLPIHVERVGLPDSGWTAAEARGGDGLEDGFDFLEQVECRTLDRNARVEFVSAHDPPVRGWYTLPGGGALWRAIAPGPPGEPPRRFHWLRVTGERGAIVGVWSPRGTVASVAVGESRIEAMATVSTEETVPESESESQAQSAGGTVVLAPTRPFLATLAQAHYRGSDSGWLEAGSPTAEVRLALVGSAVELTVRAHTGSVVVPPAGAENPFDNERADVNADGVQCYLGGADPERWHAAWLLVPDPESGRLRQTCLAGSTTLAQATWRPIDDGWELSALLPLALFPGDAVGPVRFDVLVNERPHSHARRRGQLVLSGAAGEFVYLRGDRHQPERALRLLLEQSAAVR